MNKYYVYVLEIENDGEIFYIGKGSNGRASCHKYEARNIKNQNYLYRKIRKIWADGGDFKYKIVFYTDNEQLAFNKEIELIKLFGRQNLCNLTDGGEGINGKNHTEETKKKIGDKNRGRKHTPETIQKMREVHTGQTLSPEEWKRQNDLIWANPDRLNHLRAEAAKTRKPVRRVDTGEIFESVFHAATFIDRKSNSLSAAIKQKRPCNGILFEFV